MKNLPISISMIERRIYLIRGQKVMLDSDLAELYEVSVKRLNEAVKRNISRFPSDFILQLNKDEAVNARYQIGTLKQGENIKYLPYAFTEHGVAMLSSVLRSDRAVEVNIEIMRTFSKLREILGTHKDLAQKLEVLEQKYDKRFKVVFDAIKQLMGPAPEPKPKIGF